MYKTMKIRKKFLICTALFLALSILFLIVADAVTPKQSYTERYPALYADLAPTQPPPQKTAYLTFDDGPSKVTPIILDLLKKENIQATFFVIGRTDEQDINTLKRIQAEGHSIGLHSYSHQYQEIYRSVDAYLADFEKLDQWLYDTLGIHPKIFRFPGGSNNATAKRSTMLEIVTEMTRRGYRYHDWNVIAHDDRKASYSPEQLYQNVVNTAKNKLDRSLTLLFHDNATRTTTAEALPMVIAYLRNEGYVFEKLTPTTPPIQFNRPK